MRPSSTDESRIRPLSRSRTAVLGLILLALGSPTWVLAQGFCPPTNTEDVLSLDLPIDATAGVDLGAENLIYIGNAFDYEPDLGWEQIELTIFVNPYWFDTGHIRLWVHSARRGLGGPQEITLLHDQTIELRPTEVMMTGDLWVAQPRFPAIWKAEPLVFADLVPPCHDLVAIGFVVDLEAVVSGHFLPGFSSLGYISGPVVDVPRASSLFSDPTGFVNLGLTWEHLVMRLPVDYLEHVDESLKAWIKEAFKDGSTHIRIHVRPTPPPPPR